MNIEIESFNRKQLNSVLPHIDVKNLYELQSRDEVERQNGIKMLAQAFLGLNFINTEDLSFMAVEKRIEQMTRRSSASHFGHLIRNGYVNYSDIREDGTIDIDGISQRLSYLETETLQFHVNFLRNYQVSKSTLKRIPHYKENELEVNITLSPETGCAISIPSVTDSHPTIKLEPLPEVKEVTKPPFITREVIPGIEINVPTSSYEQNHRGNFLKGFSNKFKPFIQSAQKAMSTFLS